MGIQQSTNDHIMGSGATDYSWYFSQRDNFEYDDNVDAPDGWSTVLTMPDSDSSREISVVVDHDRLIDAMQRIADTDVKNVGPQCKIECVAFLNDPEDADFDADTADQVLQVLAYGEVVYG